MAAKMAARLTAELKQKMAAANDRNGYKEQEQVTQVI